MELAWLKKTLPASVEVRRSLLEPDHLSISLGPQCDILELPRSTSYYVPLPESDDNLALMQEIDRIYLDNASYGSRTITALLANSGWSADRKRVQCLMRHFLDAVVAKVVAGVERGECLGHRVFPLADLAHHARNRAAEHHRIHTWCQPIERARPIVRGRCRRVRSGDRQPHAHPGTPLPETSSLTVLVMPSANPWSAYLFYTVSGGHFGSRSVANLRSFAGRTLSH